MSSPFRTFMAAAGALMATGALCASAASAAPVLYGADSQEPYTTRPSDVLGWVIDHYNDHTQQVADLLAQWKRTHG